MKLSSIYQSILLFGAIASAAPAPVEGPGEGQWKLRAITGRGVTPPIDSWLEVVDGAVVAGASLSSRPSVGFTSYVNPTPKGELHLPNETGLGYLVPSTTTPQSSNLYDFKFGGVPKTADVMYTGFFATGAGCGSHCGGPMLVYDETPDDVPFFGEWLAAPRKEGGYFIRWFDGAGQVPDGHVVVYLMRDSV